MMALYKSFVKIGYVDIRSERFHTAWIICVEVCVSHATGPGVKSWNAPTWWEDVVHVPTTPDALQGPPN